MSEQITNYSCPACTGPLQYGAGSGKLECEYCGSSFAVAEVEALYAQKEEKAAAAARTTYDTAASGDDWGADAASMRTYSCPSCSAELICEETTAATCCPYCGNPTLVPGQFTGALRPEFVIPFRLNKAQAMEKLKAHYKGKRFLPDLFTRQHTVEKIQGVYVPFWLYDGTVSGDYRYKTTTVHVTRRGGYEITTTNHYIARRAGTVSFEKVPVDASRKMPDDYMDSLEPYDYSELKPFSSAYLPGFLADKYDMSAEECSGRADRRCICSLEDEIRASLAGYTTCIPLPGNDADVERGAAHYTLLPVWMLTVKWKEANYLFAVNGQTGKVCGRLPASKKKALTFFASLAVPLSLLAAALAFFAAM